MYRYDEFDHEMVQARVDQFRDQVNRRLSGEISEDAFKPLRLMNGVYLQLHAYMIRIAIPYGTLSSRQMRMLGHIARTYDRGYGHFTTRQNIQFNWPELVRIPDLLQELASVEMHAIQTSGNCIRNVTADQYAGAIADEVEDPRVLSEIIRQWSTFHPEFSFLPRKFKIAVSAHDHDRAAIRFHDIGISIERDTTGAIGYDVYVGGGLGRTPIIGKCIGTHIHPSDILAYLEAVMRVYNRFGRRDNAYKARIKILVHEIGAEAMRAQVEAEFEKNKTLGRLHLSDDIIAQIQAYFADPDFETLDADCPALTAACERDRAFAHWVQQNTVPHKKSGYRIVNISLKPTGGIPGDATDIQMEGIADIAEAYSCDEIRVTHEQNLVLPHVRLRDLFEVYEKLTALGVATANLGWITDQIACPGLDYCNLANARSIPLAQQISNRFADPDRQADIGALSIKISGCINACGHHHIGNIGILGVDKKGTENYQLTLGGRPDEKAAIGEITGPSFTEENVVDAIETIVDTYRDLRQEGEAFIDTYQRVGMAPFKERLYG